MVNRLTFRASAAGLLATSALLCAWALVTLLRLGSFGTAARSVFSQDPRSDTTVTVVKLEYLAGPFFSVVFGLACAVLAVLLLRRARRWVPIAAVLCSIPIAVLAILAYALAGRPFISAIGTGPGKGAAIREMNQVDHLTQWRFSGWYHLMSVGLGVAIIMLLAVVVTLLVRPVATRESEGAAARGGEAGLTR